MKRYLVEFSVKLSEDNVSNYGLFYVNGFDIEEAYHKMFMLVNVYLAKYDDFEIINIKRV